MRSRKILLYLPALMGGGAERVFALLASAFVRRGHAVLFAVDYEAPENLGFLDPRVRLILLPRGHLRATLGLRALLAREKPDVSLSGIGVSNLKHMIAATLAGRRKRSILSFHAFFITESSGLLTSLGNALTPLFTRWAGHSVAVSDGLRQDLIHARGGYAPRLTRIHNPVVCAPAERLPDAAALRARPPHVLYMGRLHPGKAVDTLLEAFTQVQYPGARLLLAGDGAERAQYEALAERLGIRGRCDFLGYLKDPGEAFGQARVFAFPSLRESFGNVTAEALGHGLPVVATATVGAQEVLDQGRHGTIVPVGDSAALARGIDAALADPGEPGPRIAHAARFAPEHAADQYMALFEAVIARAG